jgi:hypothetical protein
MTKLLVLLSMLANLDGLSAAAVPLERMAHSDGKSEERPSGARLTYRETGRSEASSGELIHYALHADGLPQGKSYSLGGKWMNGRVGVIKGLHIDGSGRVLTADGQELDLVLGRMFPGEFIEFILAADDGAAKAAVEITPFPIEAVGNGGCRLSVKPTEITGQIFRITGSGFQPDQKIRGGSTSDGEAQHQGWKTKSDGTLPNTFILPAVRGKSGGEASVTASDNSCSVTVRYHWGSEMTRAAPEGRATAPASPLPTESQAPAGPQSPTASAQLATTPTPELSKGGQWVRLAMLTVNLDYKIAAVRTFLPMVKDALHLGEEEITHQNAKDVLERYQRERRVLTEEIDREGFSRIGGDYDWRRETQDECKLKELPSDPSGQVTVIQNGHEVEFKGKGLEGCGVVVGTIAVLKTGKCGGVSTMRLVVGTDQGRMVLLDTGSGIRCDAGTLTKR